MKRKISLVAMSILYIGAGINHFIQAAFYLKIMPWYFPYSLQLVYLSGVAEIVLGALFLFQKTRLVAAWLIIVMLIAFLTVHVQMIIDNYKDMGITFWISILRLPLQFLLIRWAYILRDTDFNRHKKAIL